MQFNIVPYKNDFARQVAELENNTVQGHSIRLKIIKEGFLNRAAVFTKVNPLVAVDDHRGVVGTAVGAESRLSVNGREFPSGFVFDAKVHAEFRNRGIGRTLAQHQKNWFREQGWTNNFTTLKLSNSPVIRISAKAASKIWLRRFLYLTIPTNINAEIAPGECSKTVFGVRLFNSSQVPQEFYSTFEGDLGLLHTWKLYQLKIENIAWLYRKALQCMKAIAPQRYSSLPEQGETLRFGTLFNQTSENIHHVSKVLRSLERDNVQFLLVCCAPGDAMHKALSKYSINTYGYYLLSDFPLSANDELLIDVRCL